MFAYHLVCHADEISIVLPYIMSALKSYFYLQ